MDTWRAIVGYEGYYEVSDGGMVRSVSRYVTRSDGVTQHRRARLKKLVKSYDGYMTVKLSKNGESKRYYVHRLVYEAFVGELQIGYEINHKDFDRTNNVPENLEAVSHSENISYTVNAGRHYGGITDLSGINNPNYGNHKLSEKYAMDSKLSKEKQGRPGIQNGRCRKIRAIYPDGTIKDYGYIKECINDLISSGISPALPNSIYCGIYSSIKRGTRYNNIVFMFI